MASVFCLMAASPASIRCRTGHRRDQHPHASRHRCLLSSCHASDHSAAVLTSTLRSCRDAATVVRRRGAPRALSTANERHPAAPLLRTPGGALGAWRASSRSACCPRSGWPSRSRPTRRFATPTSRTTTSTDRSAASRASRCCGRSAACCRPTGSSARCRPSAAIGCPGGYASFGFIVEPGHELPVGISRRHRIGIDHVGLNCAVCHSGTVRDTPTSAPRVVLGMPAHQLDLQGFVQFVLECTLDSRVTAEAVRGHVPARRRARHLRAAAPAHRPDGPPQAADARPAGTGSTPILARARAALGPRARGHVQPVQGDPVQLEPRPAARLGADRRVRLPVAVEPGAARGHAAALGRRQRLGGRAQPERRPRRRHHAGDGRSRRVEARPRLDLDAAAAGLSRIRWTRRWPRAARRSTGSTASSCHGDHRFRDGVKRGDRVGPGRRHRSRSRPIAHRLDSYTATFALNQYGLFPDSRVPLHALPQDARLRQPAARRHLAARALPAQRLGADAARSAERAGAAPGGRSIAATTCSTRQAWASCRTSRRPADAASPATTRRVPGNGNMGHEYGTTLPDADKAAIVEYLKTF